METRVCLLALCALLLVRFGGAAVTDDDQAAAASASEREAPEDPVAPEIPEDSVAPEAPEGPVAPEGPEAPEAGSSPEPIAHDAATASPSVADANTQTSGAVGSSGNGTSEGETNHEAPEGPGAPELKTDPNVQENQTTSQPLTPPPSPPHTSTGTTTNTITTTNHSTTTTIPTDTTTTTNTSNITSNNTTTNTSNITSTTGPAHAANTTTAGTPTTTPPPPTSKTTHQAPLPDLVTPSDEPALNTTFPPPAATRPETAKPDTTATGVHVATWTPAAGVSSRGTTGSGSESPTQNAARADEHPGTSSEAQPRRTVGPPSSSPASSARAKAHADNPSQLNVGDDPTMVHDSPTLDPLLAGLVSAFIITAVVVTLLLFLKLRRRDNRPEFRRLQDLPMDDMMEDTPLSMYSY